MKDVYTSDKQAFNEMAKDQPEWLITKPEQFSPYDQEKEYYLMEEMYGLCYFKSSSGIKLLCVGAGSGQEAEFFSKKGWKTFCTDISINMLKCLRVRTHRRKFDTPIFVADANNLPINKKKFDVVMAFGILHHIPNPYQALLEFTKVAQEILICEPITSLVFDILARFGLAHREEFPGLKPSRFRIRDLSKFLEEQHFPLIQYRTYLWIPTDWLPQRIVKSKLISHMAFWLLTIIPSRILRIFNFGNILILSAIPLHLHSVKVEHFKVDNSEKND